MQKYAEAETNKAFIAQLPKNLITNIAYFIINIIIGILLVPYFISTLGIAAYGLIPLATSITGYVGIVILSLNTAVARYLTIDLQQEDYVAANRTFNTAVIGLSAIIAIMIPVIIAIAYFVPKIFNVPAGFENEAVFLFLGVFASLLIRSWSGNFTVPLFAYNRLDIQNIVNIINLIITNGLIILYFKAYNPNLAFIGIANMIGAIIASAIAIILSKRICPYLKLAINSFDRSRLKALLDMGSWSIVNQIGSLLFLQIDLIVVNILFGAAISGEYAIALMWGTLLRSIASVISGVMTPMVFTYYAKGKIETLIKMMKSSVRLMGLLMALPIGLLCGFAPQILTIWVGEKFAFLAPLVVLMALHLTINLAVLPLFSINVAYNKIRVPGIVTLIMGGLNISLAVGLPLLAGWGFYGVAVAGAIVLTMKNAIFTPWYATKVMGINTSTFTRSMLPGIAMAIIIITGSIAVSMFVPLTSLISLALVGCVFGIIYLFIIWKFILNKFELGLIGSYLPESLRRLVV